jgi:hypothetical protein
MTSYPHLEKTMRIDAPEGTKVKFSFPQNGYPHDKEHARKFLKVGEVYAVKKTIIHKWTTDVFLEEIPSTVFNSVLFEEVADEKVEAESNTA